MVVGDEDTSLGSDLTFNLLGDFSAIIFFVKILQQMRCIGMAAADGSIVGRYAPAAVELVFVLVDLLSSLPNPRPMLP